MCFSRVFPFVVPWENTNFFSLFWQNTKLCFLFIFLWNKIPIFFLQLFNSFLFLKKVKIAKFSSVGKFLIFFFLENCLRTFSLNNIIIIDGNIVLTRGFCLLSEEGVIINNKKKRKKLKTLEFKIKKSWFGGIFCSKISERLVFCVVRGRVLYTTKQMPTHSLQGWPAFFQRPLTDGWSVIRSGQLLINCFKINSGKKMVKEKYSKQKVSFSRDFFLEFSNQIFSLISAVKI